MAGPLDDLTGKTIYLNGVPLPDRKNLAITADGATASDSDVTNTTSIDLSALETTVADGAITEAKLADGAVSAEKLDAYAGAYATYAALRTALAAGEMSTGDTVRVASRATAGDGGHGEFRIAAIGSYVDNDGTIFTGGSFAALRKIEGPIYPEWFGAVGDGATDDAQEFQKCIDLLGSAGGTIALTPGKTYMISTTVDLQEAYRIRIDGQGALIRINDSLGSSSAFNLQSAKYCKLENVRVLVEEAFSGIVFDLRGQLSPATYTDTQYCKLRGIDLEGTGSLGTWDGVSVALGGAVNCSIQDSSLVGGLHQIVGTEESIDATRRGYANVIKVDRVAFANHDDYSVQDLGEAWEFSSCTFAQSSGGLAQAITHEATANAFSLNVYGCWFGDVQDIGGSGDWVALYRTIGIDFRGNFSYAPNGSTLRIYDGCQALSVTGNRMGGSGGYGVRISPGAGTIPGVDIHANSITASTPISGLNSAILYRVESNNGVSNVCYGFNVAQESTQVNDAYLYVGPKFSGLPSNYLSGVLGFAYSGGFDNGSIVIAPSTHSSQDAGVYLLTRDGSNAPTVRVRVNRQYVELPNSTPFGLSSYTVAGVPTASSHTGRTIRVSNGDFGQPCEAMSDGTNWICTRSGLPVATAAYTNAASAPSSGIAAGVTAYFSTGAAGSPCLGFWDGAAWKRAELPGTSVS